MIALTPPARMPTVPADDHLTRVVSASRLNTFHSCRLKFYFRYALELVKPSTAALFVGKAVHAALQAWSTARWRGQPHDAEALKAGFLMNWITGQEDAPVSWEAGEEDEQQEKAWGLVDSHEIIARFEAERQTLALMEHPNIAAVLDAGTTDLGRPYFVMELVKGVPITDYCDAHKLGIRERLELFIPVCQAVQHAHQKSILHRDLKPSNILVAEVDGKPVPKVIDFGIAKALGATQEEVFQASLAHTQQGMVIGTPQYMSPEQAGSRPDVDTRSDIYTLGVILHELLTGQTPLSREELRAAAFDEVLRLIREGEIKKPSSRLVPVTKAVDVIAGERNTESKKLGNALRGDLDWILLKTLEKDRNRRYETATALGQDLRSYLKHEPVSAGPPSAGYRLRKLVRRNRLAFAAAAAILMSLAAGIIVSTWQSNPSARPCARSRACGSDRQHIEGPGLNTPAFAV